MRRLIVPTVLAFVGLSVAFALLRSGAPLRTGTPLRSGTALLPAARPDPLVLISERARVRVVTITDGLVEPWALAFLPNGDMLPIYDVLRLPFRIMNGYRFPLTVRLSAVRPGGSIRSCKRCRRCAGFSGSSRSPLSPSSAT